MEEATNESTVTTEEETQKGDQSTSEVPQQESTPEETEQDVISKKVEEARATQLQEANEKKLPGDFVRPTVGRIVHFFPHPNDKQARANNVEFIPAIITREYGDHRVDLRIFPAIEEKSMYTRRVKIPHKVKAAAPDVITTGTWDWPGRV